MDYQRIETDAGNVVRFGQERAGVIEIGRCLQ